MFYVKKGLFLKIRIVSLMCTRVAMYYTKNARGVIYIFPIHKRYIYRRATPEAAPAGALADLVGKSTDPNLHLEGHLYQRTMLVRGNNNRDVYGHDTDRMAVAIAEEIPFKIEIVPPTAPLVRDGSIDLKVVADTGAYGTHGLTVQMVTAFRGLSTYRLGAAEFDCDVVYTNKPTPGAYRGYGAPQALFALECHLEEIAAAIGWDPIEFKRKNWVRAGDEIMMARAMGEGREGFAQWVTSNGLEECVQEGMRAMDWERKTLPGFHTPYPDRPHIRRGLGVALCMHGTGIAGLDMGAASLKINDDGSFNLLVGATDLGTGSDTVLAQICAETLGVPLRDIIIFSSDTDFTPFDTGAYASSTTYISGGAVLKVAEQVRDQIIEHAVKHLLPGADAERVWLEDQHVCAPDGRKVSLEKVALHATHQADQHQIMATASHMSYVSPPPFACLLYTSDAADDLLCVDLGGRRIIKKKKHIKRHETVFGLRH